jgi:hypothetical protein
MLKFYHNFAIFRFIRRIPESKQNEILQIRCQYSVKFGINRILHSVYILIFRRELCEKARNCLSFEL